MGKLYVQDTVVDNSDNDWLAKCKGYLTYIDEHITNVGKAYKILFEKPFTEVDSQELQIPVGELNKARLKAKEAIQTHDESKYSDEEFDGYRAHFFRTTDEQNKYDTDKEFKLINDENYEEAWEHHYKNNDHHPKYWKFVDIVDGRKVKVNEEKSEATEMPLYAILHMLCDWQAMSIKFNNKVSEWYATKATEEKEDMNPNTKVIVDRFVEWIKNYKE